MRVCTLVAVFERAAGAAGPDLTRDTFAAAVEQIDAMPLGYGPSGSFGPGKPDAADLTRTVRFDPSCRCWIPTGDFASVRG